MKIKPNESAMTAFSKHFKRIFGGNTTFGEIAEVKKQQVSSANPMGDHVEKHLKEQSDHTNTKTKESL